MAKWTARKTTKNESARSQKMKAHEDEKYAATTARNAGRVAAYRAGFEAGKSGLPHGEARYEYEKTLSTNMSAKESASFHEAHWASSHGEECEF